MNDLINQELKNNILKITLNNPLAQNTLSLDIINNLKKIIFNADTNNEVKVVIIASTGKIFSAGHNLKEINNHREDKDKGIKLKTGIGDAIATKAKGIFDIIMQIISTLFAGWLLNYIPVIIALIKSFGEIVEKVVNCLFYFLN